MRISRNAVFSALFAILILITPAVSFAGSPEGSECGPTFSQDDCMELMALRAEFGEQYRKKTENHYMTRQALVDELKLLRRLKSGKSRMTPRTIKRPRVVVTKGSLHSDKAVKVRKSVFHTPTHYRHPLYSNKALSLEKLSNKALKKRYLSLTRIRIRMSPANTTALDMTKAELCKRYPEGVVVKKGSKRRSEIMVSCSQAESMPEDEAMSEE